MSESPEGRLLRETKREVASGQNLSGTSRDFWRKKLENLNPELEYLRDEIEVLLAANENLKNS